MEEKELKTSVKQRIIIGLIAFIMVGSMLASYAAIIINGNKSASGTQDNKVSEEKIAAYQQEYAEAVAKFQEVSAADFKKFSAYRGEIKGYNEASANEAGLATRDLEKGTGRKLTTETNDYLAYYVGWCADETIFDSSFDNKTEPTAFNKALDVSAGMIEGWVQGVAGMRLGGVREITIPGELAYGDKMEICGGLNKPLKFLVMAVENEDPLKTASSNVDTAYMKVQYAMNGIDYDEMMGTGSATEAESTDTAESE